MEPQKQEGDVNNASKNVNRAFAKNNKKFILIFIILLMVCIFAVFKILDKRQNQEVGSKPTQTTEADINGYRLVMTNDFYPDEGFSEQKLQISKDGKVEFETSDQKFTSFDDQYDFEGPSLDFDTAENFIKNASKDVNNDKIPELVFMGWSGGAHCCFTGYILEVGEKISVLWSQDTEDASAELVDIDKDGVMEIKTADAILKYWYINFSDSPFPYVFLSYNKEMGKYTVNQSMIRKPAPPSSEIKLRASPWTGDSWGGSDCKGIEGECAPWAYAIKLIYTGNSKQAKEYIDLAWRDNSAFASKEIFIKELKEKLQESSYYKELSPGLINLDQL